MSQLWSTNFFDGDHTWSTDLQNIENGLFTLRSMFSGTSAPANPLEGAPWADTTQKVLKVYTGATWNGLMHGDAAQKLWVYRDSAMAGWVVDSSVSDRVLAFKGGITYTGGGVGAGSWTISGVTGGSMALSTAQMPVHNHSVSLYSVYNSQGSLGIATDTYRSGYSTSYVSCANAGSGATHAHGASSHDGLWRPAASVGTLQGLDL